MISYEALEGILPEKIVEELIELNERVFVGHPINKDKLREEISAQRKLRTIVARDGESIVGFKMGYERRLGKFYSWLGGVDPEYRGKGIAKSLMKNQHEDLKKVGYSLVSTQTGNEFRNMLILNLKSGFDVKGTFVTSENKIRIVLEKNL